MGTAVKGKILIIEDDASLRRVYQDMCKVEGYSFAVAEDGEKGWQMVKTEKPDLILLDLVMPKMHGFEVLKNIRGDSETKDIPVLIMTALDEQEDIHKGLELGANDYLIKGFFSPSETLAKVRAVLSSVKARQGGKAYRLFVKEGSGDATLLQGDLGFTRMFNCPQCHEEVFLNLIVDYSKTDSHWFSSCFVCPKCGKSF
jgi:DNA-binding response OmpR family regulator